MPPPNLQQSEAQKQSDLKRDNFRVKTLLIVAPLSALTCCFLTGQWGGIISFLFIFGVVLFFGVNFLGAYFASRSIVFPVAALILAMLLVGYCFDSSVSRTWQERVGAVARDGWISSATGRGAASHHGGVDHWITVPHTKMFSENERWATAFGKCWFVLPIFGISAALMAERCFLGRRKSNL